VIGMCVTVVSVCVHIATEGVQGRHGWHRSTGRLG